MTTFERLKLTACRVHAYPIQSCDRCWGKILQLVTNLLNTQEVSAMTEDERFFLREDALFALTLADQRKWGEDDVVRHLAKAVLMFMDEQKGHAPPK